MAIQEQFKIYILSSSIDDVDIDKAECNPLVSEFLSKPLSLEIMAHIFESNISSLLSAV